MNSSPRSSSLLGALSALVAAVAVFAAACSSSSSGPVPSADAGNTGADSGPSGPDDASSTDSPATDGAPQTTDADAPADASDGGLQPGNGCTFVSGHYGGGADPATCPGVKIQCPAAVTVPGDCSTVCPANGGMSVGNCAAVDGGGTEIVCYSGCA